VSLLHRSSRPQARARLIAAFSALLLAVPAIAQEAAAGGRDLVPVAIGVIVADTGFSSFGSITDLPDRRQVLLTSPNDNKLAIHNYDGGEQFSRIVAGRPVSSATVGNQLFVLFQGVQPNEGRIDRVDPATLTATTLISGLNLPQGLASAAGQLFTTAIGQPSQRDFVRINPNSGATAVLDLTFGSAFLNVVSTLMADPMNPNRFYGIGESSFITIDLVNLEARFVGYGTTLALVPGEVVAAGNLTPAAPGYKVQPFSSAWSGTDWAPNGANGRPAAATGVASSQNILAVWARGTAGDSFVAISGVQNRLPQIGRVDLPQVGEPLAGGMVVTQDSSRVMTVTKPFGSVLITVVGGVTAVGAPQAPAITQPRVAAPQAPSQTAVVPRTPAPQTTRPIIVQRSVADIEFDGLGRGYIADPLTNSINIYQPDGTAITVIENADGVTSLVLHNGEMLAYFAGRHRIAKVSTETSSFEFRCVTYGLGLISMNGSLYSGEWLRRINTSTCEETAFGADLLSRSPVPFEEGVVPAGLLAKDGRFDLNLNTWVIAPTDLVFRAAVPGINAAIDSLGRRYDAVSFVRDGAVFPGETFAVSSETPRRVAAASAQFANQIRMYDYESGGVHTPLSTISIPPGLIVERMEFQPSTGALWIALKGGDGRITFRVVTSTMYAGNVALNVLSPGQLELPESSPDVLAPASVPESLVEPPLQEESAPLSTTPTTIATSAATPVPPTTTAPTTGPIVKPKPRSLKKSSAACRAKRSQTTNDSSVETAIPAKPRSKKLRSFRCTRLSVP
jgi:hypothetical protein